MAGKKNKKRIKRPLKAKKSTKRYSKRSVAKTLPKKRKSSYKAKTKGVRYIAVKLVKYFPKKYPKYQDALPKAREIFNEMSASGSKVRLVDIFPKIRQKRGEKASKIPPYLPEEMMEPIPFWEIDQSYPSWIAASSNKLEFRSSISPETHNTFKGGENVDYQTHFKSFVDFSNKIFSLMRAQGEEVTSDDGALVVTTPPVFDKKTQTWYSEIISCDEDKNKQDYGFDTYNPDLEPDEIIVPESKETLGATSETTKPTIEPPAPSAAAKTEASEVEPLRLKLKIEEEATKRAEIERSTQLAKTLETMNDLLAKDLITKLEWKEFYASILNKMK